MVDIAGHFALPDRKLSVLPIVRAPPGDPSVACTVNQSVNFRAARCAASRYPTRREGWEQAAKSAQALTYDAAHPSPVRKVHAKPASLPSRTTRLGGNCCVPGADTSHQTTALS